MSNPRSTFSRILFGNDLKKGGMYVVASVKVGTVDQDSTDATHELRSTWRELIKAAQLKCFFDSVISSSIRAGIQSLLMTSGLGGMRPNIVVLGFFREQSADDQLLEWRDTAVAAKSSRRRLRGAQQVLDAVPSIEEARRQPRISLAEYVGVIRDALLLEKSVCIFRNFSAMHERYRFAKIATKSSGERWYFDVWPIVSSVGAYKLSFEMTFQLGLIAQRVRRWQKWEGPRRSLRRASADGRAHTKVRGAPGRHVRPTTIGGAGRAGAARGGTG